MTTPIAPPDLDDPQVIARLQNEYEAAVPRILAQARAHFSRIRDPGRRDDAFADVLGIGWMHWLSATRHGKNPNEFVSSIAEKAVRQVRSYRRVTGTEKARDAMSPAAQRKKGFMVEQLDGSTARSYETRNAPHGQDAVDAVEERLADNRRTPPPDQAAFREQWRTFLEKLGAYKRPIVVDMAAGETTQDLAHKYGKTEGRISQIRREAADEWDRLDQGAERGR